MLKCTLRSAKTMNGGMGEKKKFFSKKKFSGKKLFSPKFFSPQYYIIRDPGGSRKKQKPWFHPG